MTALNEVTMLEEFDQAHVHIKNKSDVQEKLKLLFAGGASSLQIISDYDMTLSRHAHGNQKCPTSHGILEDFIDLTPERKAKHSIIVKKYRAIEIDPHMSVEEKIPYMLEWWSKSHEAMGNAEIRRTDITKAVAKAQVTLKDGCNEFFSLLNQESVPLLIFSAGLGDVIEEVIRQRSKYYGNMKVVSNFMEFDDSGCMVGFHNQLIHTFNKNEGALEHSAYFEEISHRHNIILVGDMMGDLNMADGVDNINTILKIGYLNEVTPESLSKFMEAWDIVLTDDHSVQVLMAIVSKIIGN